MNTHFALNIKLHDDCWGELYPFCFWKSEQKFIDDIRYDRGRHLQFGFWSTRILHYFPLSSFSVHSSVRHGRDISTFLDNLDHEYHIFSESRSSTLIILTTWTDLIFVTNITNYIRGEKNVLWRNFSFPCMTIVGKFLHM